MRRKKDLEETKNIEPVIKTVSSIIVIGNLVVETLKDQKEKIYYDKILSCLQDLKEKLEAEGITLTFNSSDINKFFKDNSFYMKEISEESAVIKRDLKIREFVRKYRYDLSPKIIKMVEKSYMDIIMRS